MRILLALVAFVVAQPAIGPEADACCVGCPCTKYKNKAAQEHYIQEVPEAYAHSVAGGIPRWSYARIATFLSKGTWKPLPSRSPSLDQPAEPNVTVIPAPTIQFITADKAGTTTRANPVLIRRIEKHGKAILVEVEDRTYKLAPCPRKKNTTCLVDPGGLALDPIEPLM